MNICFFAANELSEKRRKRFLSPEKKTKKIKTTTKFSFSEATRRAYVGRNFYNIELCYNIFVSMKETQEWNETKR